MTTTTCRGLLLLVALYMGVGSAVPTVVHTPQQGSDGVFPQVTRVIMPEDLDRCGG